MSNCEAQKGFLTLSGCENPAVTACSNCGRSMCSTHLAPQTGFSMCFDCAATSSTVQEEEYDDVWSHRYRNSYYTSTGYTPRHYSSTDSWDRQDARSFDERARDAAEDEGGRGRFGDS